MTKPVDDSWNSLAEHPGAGNQTGAMKGRSVFDMSNRLAEIKKIPDFQTYYDYKYVAPHYAQQITVCQRAVATTLIALLIIGIIALGVFTSNNFSLTFQSINPIQLSVGIGAALVLITGAGIVIYRACTKKEKLLGDHNLEILTYQEGGQTTRIIKKMTDPDPCPKEKIISRIFSDGPLSDRSRGPFIHKEDQLQTALRIYEVNGQERSMSNFYVDMSTAKSGKAFLYTIKECDNHYMISSIVPLLATLPYMIATMVYNLLRAVIIPFYVLVQWLREKCIGEQLYPEQRPFECVDIFIESGKSLWRVFKAPFYAVAYIGAYLYSFAKPFPGRELSATIERRWNEGVTFEEGYWLPGLCAKEAQQKFWRFEGGGGSEKLGQNATYVAPCQQPHGFVLIDEQGKVKGGYRMEARINPKGEKPFQIIFRKDLEAKLSALSPDTLQKLENLYQEYEQLKFALKNSKEINS